MSAVNEAAGPTGRPTDPVPSVRAQWGALGIGMRLFLVAGPVAVVAVVALFSTTLGVVVAVLVFGMALATVVYAKNRSDRLNALEKTMRGDEP